MPICCRLVAKNKQTPHILPYSNCFFIGVDSPLSFLGERPMNATSGNNTALPMILRIPLKVKGPITSAASLCATKVVPQKKAAAINATLHRIRLTVKFTIVTFRFTRVYYWVLYNNQTFFSIGKIHKAGRVPAHKIGKLRGYKNFFDFFKKGLDFLNGMCYYTLASKRCDLRQ